MYPLKPRLTVWHRFTKGTSTDQGQASVERVFNEYHPIGKEMLMITASRMTATVLAIHNKAHC
jgi:hypothetical protein